MPVKKPIYLFLFLLIASYAQAQTLTPAKICDLPAELAESSGLLNVGANRFLSHGDSGNEPIVYVYDSSGIIVRRIRIGNATNVDWEDLAKDTKGNIYIGDFGNNLNDRKDLRIYIIFDPKNIPKDTTNAGIINFTYSDQKAFPPPAARQNYDMEAFFWYQDSLYLFSKDRSTPYSGYTKCYRLPAKTGTFTAQLIDSFYTGNGSYLNFSVTAAAINAAGTRVLLMGYDKCWLFTGFTGKKFLRGKVTTYPFMSLTQREAVYFENDYSLIYTQETAPLVGNAGMYRAALPQAPSGLRKPQQAQTDIEVYPNPVYESFQFLVRTKATRMLDVMLYDTAGKKVKSWNVQSNLMQVLEIAELPGGVYFIRLADGSTRKLVKE